MYIYPIKELFKLEMEIQMAVKAGEYFLERGLITDKNLKEALEFQTNKKTFLGETLLHLGFITESDLLQYLSKRFNVQFISTDKMEKMSVQKPSDIIPEKLALEKNIFPLKYSFNSFRLTLITHEPQNIALFDELKILLSGVQTVVPVVAISNAVKALIFKQYHGDLQSFERLVKKGVDLNLMIPGNENVIGGNIDNTIGNVINDIRTESKEKAENEFRDTFSMIVNQGEILNMNDSSSVTASMISHMPSWAKEQKGQMIELLRIFSNLLDSQRERSFFGHTQRVAALSQELGENLNLSEVELHDLLLASYLHDVGKKHHVIAIDIADKVNPERFVRYSGLASKLFNTVDLSRLTLSYLENMYETYNGRGFPHGLRLDEIPTGSQILLLADSFDYITRVSKIPAPAAFKQLAETRFFSEKLLEALRKIQQIDSMPSTMKSPPLEAILISRKRFDLDDIAEKLNRLNVKTFKAEKIERAAQIIKEKKNAVNFVLCDMDMPESTISPLKLLSAMRRKKDLAEIPFYFFSQYSIEKNIVSTCRALKASGVFPNYHPIEMTRKIVEEVIRKQNLR
jgi:response regulator RpfG family c-di-GMP phosphodiesterase